MNLINNKYTLIEKIGGGTFGTIYKGQNIRTGENVAIKIEPIHCQTKMLKNESIVYQYLNNLKGIPTVKWFGKDDTNYYMVINLLGKSLQDVKDKMGKLSLQLAIKIGINILHLLQTIHNNGLIHRDIKPDNFLLGLNENNNQLYIIDFGFCKKYLINDKHIEMKKTSSIIGSHSYASINSHNCIELSRRDDLESLGYLLIYLISNQLEWQNIELPNEKERNNLIKLKKEQIIFNKNIPVVFINFLNYVRNLKFEETPNYELLTNLLHIHIK